MLDRGRPSNTAIGPPYAMAAAEEAGPVGFHLRLAHHLAIDDRQMGSPDFLVIRRPPPPASPG